MRLEIRPTAEHDYATLTRLWNESFPFMTVSAEALALEDDHRSRERFFTRLLVEQDGRPRAFGTVTERHVGDHRRAFMLDIAAGADARKDQLDDLVYRALVAQATPESPHRWLAWARSDHHTALRFWRERGFEVAQRSHEGVLDLAAVDPDDLEALAAAAVVRLPGLAFLSLGAWLERADAEVVHRDLYDLHAAVDADVPTVGTYTPPPFREFVRRHFEDPRVVRDAFTVAVLPRAGGIRPIALSELYTHHEEGRLQTGLTGVLRAYRRMGVASGVKARALLAARAAGFVRVHTWNAVENRGMRAINERIGFQPQPVMLDLAKDVG